jgi:CheY-like chemotaxis protein
MPTHSEIRGASRYASKPKYNPLNLCSVDALTFAGACHLTVILEHRRVRRMSTDSPKAPMISIVDDDPFVRQATDGLVQSLGYRAATFTSADDFLQSCYIHETSCLICDVQMPGLSGVDLQRVLIAQGHRVPMIFITAYFNERIRQSVMEAGAIGYLSKPFDEESLIELLQSTLGLDRSFGGSRDQMSVAGRTPPHSVVNASRRLWRIGCRRRR